MKTCTMLVAMLALVLSLGVAQAAKQPKPKTIKGEITKIDGATVTVQPPTKRGAEKPATVDVTTTDTTTVTIDGEKKALTDLAAKQKVTVTLDADGKTATAIVVAPAKAAKNK